MLRLFDPENRFWNFLSKIVDVCCISLLWMICSIPVITLGAATASMYNFTLHQAYDAEDTVLHGFFTGFKAYFKKATVVWLIQLAIGLFLFFDFYLAWQFFAKDAGILQTVVLGVIAFVGILFIIASFYLFPLLATFDFPVKKLFIDSVIMAVANLLDTVTLLAIWSLAAFLIYLCSGTFFVFIGLACFFSSFFIRKVFLKYSIE